MCRRCVYCKCDYSLTLCASNGMKAINTLDQVHYPDQSFVHNIIMTPYIVTNLNLTLTLNVN